MTDELRAKEFIAACGGAWSQAGAVYPTGTAYCCPNLIPNDYDFLVLAQTGCFEEMMWTLIQENGWTACSIIDGYPRTDGGWVALRKGDFNMMLCSEPVFYTRFAAATELAKKIGIEDRAPRVALFATVREGTLSDDEMIACQAVPSWLPGWF